MATAASPAATARASEATRWGQLVFGIICMVMIANLQYGWTLFVNPIDQKYHWGRAAIQVAFTIFVLTETWLVPIEGWLIDKYGPQYADLDLPIVDGLSSRGSNVVIDQPRAELVARLIASLRPEPPVAGKLSQIDVSDVHNAAVILNGDPAVIYVGEERFLQRLESYLELSSALKARVPDIDYVDLRFDDRIYVRPARAARNATGPAKPGPRR